MTPTASHSGPLLVGPEFQINTYTTYGQFSPAVSSAADSSFVIVWVSGFGGNQDGDNWGVFGQRYDAAGAPDGTEFQVNTYTTAYQTEPAVSSADDGSFVVVWTSGYGNDQDGDGYGVFGQRYDSAGAPDGTEFQVNSYTTNDQGHFDVSVSSAADGSFVVVWDSDGQDGDQYGVFGQRYDATGVPDGTEFRVNTYTTSSQSRPAVSSAAGGSFVVVWQSNGQDGFPPGVFGQRYDAAGAPDGTEFQVNSYTTNLQGAAAVSCAADGSFVVVWSSGGSPGQDGDTSGVFGQRYDSAGAPDGTEFQVNSYTSGNQGAPTVSLAADGRFVVTWGSALPAEQDGDGAGVFGQLFDATGAKDGNEFQVNTYTTGSQYVSAVSPAADGFVIAWGGGQDGDGSGVSGRFLCTDCDTSCSSTPAAGCNVAAQAKLDLNEKKAGKEKLKLQWKKLADPTVQGDFGDPAASTTAVALCIYNDADALVQEYLVDRAGDLCAGKACWKAKGTKGYGYKDKDNSSDGISKIGYGSGDAGKGKADAGGKNNSAKGQNSLPIGVVAGLTGNTAPTIQIVTSDDFCATATMNEVKKDEATRYSAQLK